ncbi:stealth family protein [Streptococcus saliviloxodontae]|uniref:Capsule biosynthesis protein CapG n=1 Tax=Streptococcus saliviloxodontae TaxID=1349416 RepID=A0ABS2PMF7_9STRE|nr:stealth family protein [Streptococcus saliviloxodontae]MBM7635983.1 hypothetical protein [Streptococcus saliviloxodontae]
MEKIDFVVTWVDGSDPEWLAQKNEFATGSDEKLNSDSRYRDWDIFKYWFRLVEKNAPWVNKIFLITAGHLPEWLNINNEKLVVVKHSDYIDAQYLPTFNSNVIELNITNLKDLSEHFVLFNDDMFIIDKVSPEDFFKNGLPLDTGIFSPIVPISGTVSNTLVNNVAIINKKFNTRSILKKNFTKYFNFKYGIHNVKNICVLPWSNILGFYDTHIPVSYLKSEFLEATEFAKEEVKLASKNKFRNLNDISHWFVRYWQLSKGQFKPRSIHFGKMYGIEEEIEKIEQNMKSSRHKLVCLEDGESVLDFKSSKEKIVKLFEEVFPEKSKFER